jgi:hypothetical protein
MRRTFFFKKGESAFMKNAGTDNQKNVTTGALWPSVLKIDNDEFRQSYAVAQLAVKLFELKRAGLKMDLLKGAETPEKFLGEAWKLIQRARERVLRPKTNAEYLQSGSDDAEENVTERILSESRIPFQKLCDADRKEGDTEVIYGVDWKVYRSEREFDKLFWAYWHFTSTLTDEGERTKYGENMLASWKRDGVPSNAFLALASGYFDFDHGVKFITGENRLDCALPWFRRFLKSRCASDDIAERAIAEYREKKFAPREPYSLKDEFKKWKREEKSRNAKLSREARGKRGRVRSKSDKRLGARTNESPLFQAKTFDRVLRTQK